jgi:hypothetical protein
MGVNFNKPFVINKCGNWLSPFVLLTSGLSTGQGAYIANVRPTRGFGIKTHLAKHIIIIGLGLRLAQWDGTWDGTFDVAF